MGGLGRDGERDGISQLVIDFHEAAVFEPIREGPRDESESQHKGGEGHDCHARERSPQRSESSIQRILHHEGQGPDQDERKPQERHDG